jgi:CheY-like chemotaxis protein
MEVIDRFRSVTRHGAWSHRLVVSRQFSSRLTTFSIRIGAHTVEPTILVVDDSRVDRHLVVGLLRKTKKYHIEMAENGRQALARLAEEPHDLVVTDLVMPEMDGLELLRAIRLKHPTIPVILLTACGNESIAVEAMQSGAASYVPKARQAECLTETVSRVLDRAAADRRRDRLARGMLHCEWRLELENDPALIRELVDQAQTTMAGINFADVGERIRVGEALEEALLNAMYHGNLEIGEQELAETRAALDDRKLAALVDLRRRQQPYSERKTLVVLSFEATEVRFVIRDEGAGFSVTWVSEIDPVKAFDRGHRRGLTLIQSIMDEVTFNSTGNELAMSKRARTRMAAARN